MGCSNSKPEASVAPTAVKDVSTANGAQGGEIDISTRGMSFTSPDALPPRMPSSSATSGYTPSSPPPPLPPTPSTNFCSSNHQSRTSLDRSGHRGRSSLTQSVSAVGLDQMIESRREEGNLTNNVVHIEVPFGKPIEEVYSGVHDGPVLGSGVSGVVRLVTHKESGVKYAVKCLDVGLIESQAQLEQLREEIFIMCQLDHPNIVRLEEVYESHSEIYLVQELCLGGELFDRLDEQPDYHYTEWECARLVKNILCSVRYIHSKGIVHRDLKLENFLFSSKNQESELKMIDFGLSKHFVFQGELHSDAVGTPYTVAPEVIKGRYDERCDVWGVGVIAFLLLSGETPFGGCGGEPMVQVRESILSGRFEFEPRDIWDQVSPMAKDFIAKLLVIDPANRPTAGEAQQHPWFKTYAENQQPDEEKDELLHRNVINSLVEFKEFSDMRKLLCEVLSFTLLPEQIQHLRKAFERYDIDGTGEISLQNLKNVLLENASDGSLGALTEDEIGDIFDAMRVRKSETKIHWHEFIAAGLSQCQVDDRNIRLAFNRLDREHKGYITFDNILDVMGATEPQEQEEIKRMYHDSLTSCRRDQTRDANHIYYEDFLLLMKGQCRDKEGNICAASPRLLPTETTSMPSCLPELTLSPLVEDLSESSVEGSPSRENVLKKRVKQSDEDNSLDDFSLSKEKLDIVVEESNDKLGRQRLRSHSFDDSRHNNPNIHGKLTPRDDSTPSPKAMPLNFFPISLQDTKRTSQNHHTVESVSNIGNNRELYRSHRKLRLAVLDASKRFEEETARRVLKEIESKSSVPQHSNTNAGLIMRRGTNNVRNREKELSSEAIRKILQQREMEHRKNMQEASKRGGRRGKRQRIVSDLTSMMSSSTDSGNHIKQNRQKNTFGTHSDTSENSRSLGRNPVVSKDKIAGPNLMDIYKSDEGKSNVKRGESNGMISTSSSDGNLTDLVSQTIPE